MCDPYTDDSSDEGADAETCAYDCYAAAGLEKACTDRNPHYDDSYQTEDFQPSRYMECSRFQQRTLYNISSRGNNKYQRSLEDSIEVETGDDGTIAYYIGPYCRHQGGNIMLGMFTDDTCSQFADTNRGKDTFRKLSGGMELPYSRVSLIGSKCITCMSQQQERSEDENGEDEGQKNLALYACQSIYSNAGKCEVKLPENTVEKPNTSACRYIQGIKNVQQDGIATVASGPNGTVNLFIVLFAVSCAILGHYIQYLRKIMKHKKIARALLS